jgi:hypothetical protein
MLLSVTLFAGNSNSSNTASSSSSIGKSTADELSGSQSGVQNLTASAEKSGAIMLQDPSAAAAAATIAPKRQPTRSFLLGGWPAKQSGLPTVRLSNEGLDANHLISVWGATGGSSDNATAGTRHVAQPGSNPADESRKNLSMSGTDRRSYRGSETRQAITVRQIQQSIASAKQGSSSPLMSVLQGTVSNRNLSMAVAIAASETIASGSSSGVAAAIARAATDGGAAFNGLVQVKIFEKYLLGLTKQLLLSSVLCRCLRQV